MGVMYFITLMENVAPVSDERVEVTEERLDGVQVVVYQPKRRGGGAELRRAVIYLHGGGWCLGSSSKSACQLLYHINGCFHPRAAPISQHEHWSQFSFIWRSCDLTPIDPPDQLFVLVEALFHVASHGEIWSNRLAKRCRCKYQHARQFPELDLHTFSQITRRLPKQWEPGRAVSLANPKH